MATEQYTSTNTGRNVRKRLHSPDYSDKEFTRSDNSNNNATAKEQPSSIQNEPEYIRTPKKPKMKVTTPASSSSSTTSTKGTTNKAATTKVINSKITTSKATNSKSTSQKRTIVSMSSRKKASQPQCQHPKHSIYDVYKRFDGLFNIGSGAMMCRRCLHRTDRDPEYTSHPNYVSAKSIYKVNERKKLVIEMKGVDLDD
ncbi:1852_t:CDS:2 [Diversispora eburnea]|uniref:1852_t:CDS:1 n=1 Tax=Diversispora eburnea TaxID=1213867 RepID=A0A9N9EW35_9GLOM|nr:1852_t:CDS:2 [Diversispora eburnea]